MTTSDPQSPVERAADDLLLLLTRVDSPDVALPGPDEVGAIVSAYATAAMPSITNRIRGSAMRAKDVTFGFTAAADAMSEAAASHLLLSIRLLAWVSKRTGLSHAEVVAEVLAQTDVEGKD